MASSDHQMPSVLRELHKVDFLYADGQGIDFEPYDNFYRRTRHAKAFAGLVCEAPLSK